VTLHAPLPPFEEVVREHGAVVLRVCRALVGPHDADDCWVETFISAMAAYPRLGSDSNVRGWLATIAHRKALDEIRRTSRRPRPSDSLPESASDDPSGEIDEQLHAALASLPDKQRRAVTLRHLADLPYAEIARSLDCSEAAARRSVSDGLAALRLKGLQQL
jgi:RNA polymerase sigma factor (sigma-70 family)